MWERIAQQHLLHTAADLQSHFMVAVTMSLNVVDDRTGAILASVASAVFTSISINRPRIRRIALKLNPGPISPAIPVWIVVSQLRLGSPLVCANLKISHSVAAARLALQHHE